jgi:hypothetical protein
MRAPRLLLALVLLASPLAAEVPQQIPFDAGVADPVFAALVGLLRGDVHGTLTGDHLRAELQRIGKPSRLPHDKLASLSRQAGSPGEADVVARMVAPLSVPIPYAILGYHPGKVVTSQTCRFRERSLGNLLISEPASAPVQLDDVHLLRLESGSLLTDVDAWLDFVLGGALDDTEVRGLAVFGWKGRLYAIAVGFNRQGRPRSGAFDFAGDKVLFPVPPELRTATRVLRAQLGLTTQTPLESAAR